MKKMLCFIMSMIIVLSFSISTNAVDFDDTEMLTMTGSYSEDDLFCDNFYYHILNDGTAEISEYVGEESTLTIPEQVNGIPVTSFKISGDNLTVLNIPSSFVSYDKYDQYMYWLGWHNLKEINVDPDNAVYSSVDGVMYNKDKTVLIQVPMAREGSSYTVPEGVSDIGYNAFYNSKISEIWLPNSLNLLSDNVFTSCQNLVDIFVGEDNPYLYSLDGVLYRGKGKTAYAIIA